MIMTMMMLVMRKRSRKYMHIFSDCDIFFFISSVLPHPLYIYVSFMYISRIIIIAPQTGILLNTTKRLKTLHLCGKKSRDAFICCMFAIFTGINIWSIFLFFLLLLFVIVSFVYLFNV